VYDTKKELMELLKKSLRPEFLNRIDETIMFRPLAQKDMLRIVEIQFAEIKQRLAESGIQLEATQAALHFLAKEGFDPLFGARPLKRTLQRLVLNELSKKIISGEVTKDAIVGLTLNEKGQLIFENLDKIAVN
jgi:ATP-dependent Clp protease ATP-binding subunit ClpB